MIIYRRSRMVLAWARQHGPAAAVEVAVNVAAPYALYSVTRAALGDVGALMAASAPPTLWSLAEFARHRRIDALSLLVLGGLLLSLLALLGGGGVRFLQLREQLAIAVVGLVFLGSAALGKPLIYQLARARLRRQGRSLEALGDHPVFQRAMMVTTLVWGAALVAEAALAGGLVFVLPIRRYLIASPILGYSALAALTAWTWRYAARRAAAARADLAASETSGLGTGSSQL
jgi:hypothetical protein